jgi:hypothetical protein
MEEQSLSRSYYTERCVEKEIHTYPSAVLRNDGMLAHSVYMMRGCFPSSETRSAHKTYVMRVVGGNEQPLSLPESRVG